MSSKIILCEWETAFFQRPIFCLELGQAPFRLPEYEGGLLWAKVSAERLAEADFLQQCGFQWVESEVELRFLLAKNERNPTACEQATDADLPELQALMGEAFPQSRFREPWFSKAEHQRFYQHWIAQAMAGKFDDVCLLKRTENGELQGAVSLRSRGDYATIGLLAVVEKYRNQGIGAFLLEQAKCWAVVQGATELMVRTQRNNSAAIRLYQHLGGQICTRSDWFYR